MGVSVKEVRNDKHLHDIVYLAEQHRAECAPHLAFKPTSIFRTGDTVFQDTQREHINSWIAYKDGKAVGYSVAYCDYFFFNDDKTSKLEIWYVLPEYRGSWAAIKLVKAYEEWARLNGAIQLYVGVARLQKDEIKHIRKLFPKMGYDWCGSYYIKETV